MTICRSIRFAAPLFRTGALLASLVVALPSLALERPRSGWYLTGSATRQTGGAKDLTVTHEMKTLPTLKTKRGVIDADVDKRFSWRVHRDLPCAAVKATLRDGFARNAYTTSSKIAPFVDTCTGTTLKARSLVLIGYVASSTTTTIWVQGMGTATVAGLDFMKAVWSLWLGNIEQPRFGEALIARL